MLGGSRGTELWRRTDRVQLQVVQVDKLSLSLTPSQIHSVPHTIQMGTQTAGICTSCWSLGLLHTSQGGDELPIHPWRQEPVGRRVELSGGFVFDVTCLEWKGK